MLKARNILLVTLIGSAFLANASLYAGIQKVKICNIPVNNGQKLSLRYKDLKHGKIIITAEVSEPENTISAEVSTDAGNNWIKLDNILPLKYAFIPQEGVEYVLLAHTLDKEGKKSPNFIAIIQPDTRELISTFEEIFKNIRNIYIDERLNEFLSFFAQDSYPNFITFKENIENTFDQSGNFNLKITIRNLALDGETALVRVDWIKTFEDISRDSGTNNIIRFHKVKGEWKIFDIEDEKIFIVGTGTFRGNVTDR